MAGHCRVEPELSPCHNRSCISTHPETASAFLGTQVKASGREVQIQLHGLSCEAASHTTNPPGLAQQCLGLVSLVWSGIVSGLSLAPH